MWTAIFVIIAIIALAFGCYVYAFPERVIDLQKRLYALINWRMEPISMAREIRNTRWMGLFLIIFTLIGSIYFWLIN